MDKRVLPLVVGLLVGVFAVSSSALGSPTERLNFGTQLNAGECDPAGTLIVNIVQRVTGDIDSGIAGNYWAFDEYSRHIQVWQVGTNEFCAVLKYTGSFTTVAGASPGGVPGGLSADVTGTMEGGSRLLITGELKAVPGWKTKGNVGTVDYNCDPVVGPSSCSYVQWIDKYFQTGWAYQYQWWGWIYRAGNNGTWVNTDPNSGDITGAP